MFEHWEEAAQHSKGKRAVARFGKVQDRNGKVVSAEIIIRDGGDANVVYRHTSRVIRRATAAEVDRLKGWEPA